MLGIIMHFDISVMLTS